MKHVGPVRLNTAKRTVEDVLYRIVKHGAKMQQVPLHAAQTNAAHYCEMR